jgi:hypothetical protein
LFNSVNSTNISSPIKFLIDCTHANPSQIRAPIINSATPFQTLLGYLTKIAMSTDLSSLHFIAKQYPISFISGPIESMAMLFDPDLMSGGQN